MPLPKTTKADSLHNDSLDNLTRQTNDTIHPFQIPTQKNKKRHLFPFGRKKSRPDMNNFGNPFSGLSDGSSILSTRKKSRDYESTSVYSNLDLLTMDDHRIYERKKSVSSYNLKGREKSEGSIFSPIEETKNDNNVEFECSLAGIIESDYNTKRASISLQGTPPDQNNEHWAAPDSWAVQPPTSIFDDIPNFSKQDQSENPSTLDNESNNKEKGKLIEKSFFIRVFRPDGTFGTLRAPLNATTIELIQKLAGKFFLHDLSKYRLSLTMHNHERILQPNERPIQIQKRVLEQMGYTVEDKIEDVGREDNSYLFRFSFKPSVAQAVPEDEEFNNYRQVELAGKSLSTVPIFLYKYASRIVSLDVSKNLLMEIPVDFLQMCKNLKSIRLTQNGYLVVPGSIRCIPHLENLDISSNALTDLESAHLGDLSQLKDLSAFNNRLTTLPRSLATLNHLTTLNISNNCFTVFPLVICQLTHLSHLDVSFNSLDAFPDEICQLTHLVDLYAAANRLRGRLPPSFSKLENLQHLDLRQNQITDLDELYLLPNLTSISMDYNAISLVHFNFKHLQSLKLSKNHLTQLTLLPLAEAGHLTELNLSDCKLSSLPDDLFKTAILLETLILDNNTLSSLPASLGHLTRLIRLSVQGNNLEDLPTEIACLTNLKELDAQKNNLKSLPQQIWHCPALQTLNCSSNLLETFPGPTDDPVLSLRYLFLGDNRFTDDVWSPLSLFKDLRTLNLCFNDLYEIPPDGLCHQHLYELYLSGNNLASLPADDIEKLSYLRVLAVNGNKLQTLPAEIGKLRKLLVLDVGNNVLKYNISNWPYDWNWNWNLGLKYLNLSGNKRLEIKRAHPEIQNPKERSLSDFGALTKLRMLGLMDITILGVSIPEEFHDRRVRTSPSEVNGLSYGVADWLGPSDHLATWDLVMPRFRNREDECVFGLFDGRKHPKTGCSLTRFLNDNLTYHLANELERDGGPVSALRRTFLTLEKEFGSIKEREVGASAVLCYIHGTQLYVANVGDCLAVLSRNNGQALEISQRHMPLLPSEMTRIREAGGYISKAGLLNDELQVSRSFGYYHLLPVVNANPFISTISLAENDEFVILASRGLWDRMSYQSAVDIARTEKDDLMAAAQKLRDFAITYGADDNLMVMVIGVGDLFDKRDKRLRSMRLGSSRGNSVDPVLLMDDPLKNKRRNKDESPSDSVLARLDREIPPPTNQVALVFTDIKSSTLLWNTQPEDMRSAIKIHDQVMRRTLRNIGGYEVKTEGDAFMVCFQDPIAALLWCFTVQLQLLEVDWPAAILETEEGKEIEKDGVLIYRGLSVRMGIHLGTPVYERNPITKRMDYFGPVVNKASRICNAADGGQICVSSDVIAVLKEIPGMLDDRLLSVEMEHDGYLARDVQQLRRLGCHVVEMGEKRLKGLETPEMLSLVYPKELMGRVEEMEGSVVARNEVSTTEFEGSPIPDEMIDPYFSRSQVKSHHIDPALVISLNNLAIRMESISSGSFPKPPPKEHTPYSYLNIPSDLIHTGSEDSPYSNMFHQRLFESASDEELVMLMDNFVTRIENASSNLYFKKMDDYSKVLEKLGDLDPLLILRAVQMYSESNDLSK